MSLPHMHLAASAASTGSPVAERVTEVRGRIADAVQRGGHAQGVTLIAVTKTYGPDIVRDAWAAGVHDVGENRIQEATAKMAAVDVPVRWHLIGHLQRNKVRQTDGFALIHSCDSARLADALDEHGVARHRPVEVLLQINVSGETSKGGYDADLVRPEAERLTTRPGLLVRGVMTIAPLDGDERALRAIFATARAARDVLVEVGHPAAELSMGMSGDYEIAVEEGATLVRVGSALFGARS